MAASKENESVVPVIDLSTGQDDSVIAEELVDAFAKIGFVTIVGHGVDVDVVRKAFAASKSFFDLPEEVKLKYLYQGHKSNRGFIAMGKEKLKEGYSDRKESFDLGNESDPSYTTPWPQELAETGFKKDLLDYFNIFDKVHLRILKLLGIGLHLPDPEFFVKTCNEQHCNLRLLHYPALDRDSWPEGKIIERGGKHTDFGTITLLTQDQVGGLQVQGVDGKWTFLSPVEGGIAVNVGDMLQRWSNDYLRATPHQVVNHPELHTDTEIPERYSIAFFCNANKEVVLEPMEGLGGAETTTNKKYAPIKAHDYLTMRLEAAIGE